MLAIFLYVVGAKTFHTHNETYCLGTDGFLEISDTNSCDVCEFQLTGSVEIKTIKIRPADPLLSEYRITCTLHNDLTGYVSTISDRGPPVVILM